VLLPTRGRPEHLVETIHSLDSRAADRSRIEYLLWCDRDDDPTLQVAVHLAGLLPLRFICGARVGYARMHEMVNDLCAIARGDWLYLFNDDARNRTQGWDEVVANAVPPPDFKGSDDVAMLGTTCPGYSPWVFPLIRRRAVQLMGRASAHPCNDTYWEKIFRPLGAYFTLDAIHVDHYQATLLDDTRKGSVELPTSDWDGGWLKDAIDQDRAVLARHLEKNQ
jgi:hypothetical protein